MKISLDWLKQYIQLEDSPQNISDKLTASGLEVEGLTERDVIAGGLKGLVVGEVLTCDRHPNADKLSITTVDIGADEPVQIVCGAANVAAGQKVVVATVGATVYPEGHEPFEIKKSKIRGELSLGMICAEDEIGLGASHDGILVLDTKLPNGTPAAEQFDLQSDHIIEIGLTPNRADATSHAGVARELAALYNEKVQWPSVNDFAVDSNELPIEIIVEDAKACPRYCGVTLKGLEVKPSPDWLKQRLLSIGLAPINNVVDITNFVLHELGQPLHAFDYDKVTSGKVVVGCSAQETPFITLDEVERKLQPTDLMIKNGQEPMCIAGVFGGIDSGVTEKTVNVFLESAYFSPDSIRKTAQHHALKTDASFRFERGVDPHQTMYALKRAALLIKEVAGGEIACSPIDCYPEPIEDFKVEVKFKNIDRLIGVAVPREEVKSILAGLDIRIDTESEEALSLTVPAYRVDVQREADIIEEILRVYGYDKVEISDHLSSSFLAHHPAKDPETVRAMISSVLTGNGYHEIITNSLTKPKYAEVHQSLDANESVEILNKLSEDLGVMRQTLLFSGLEVVAHNINRRQKNLKLYEFGKLYRHVNGKYKEYSRLAIFLSGNASEESWAVPAQKAGYEHLAQVVRMILEKMGIDQFTYADVDENVFAAGTQINVREKALLTIGELDDKINKLCDVQGNVVYAEIDMDYLFKLYKADITYENLSKFPEVRRDLSLVIDKSVSFEQINALATRTEKRLLKSVNVFDVYEGENIGSEKKSYSVSFILQDDNQTLTDKVIDKTMTRFMTMFEKELGAVIRK